MRKGGFCTRVIGFPTELVAKPAPTLNWDGLHWLGGMGWGWVLLVAISFSARRYANAGAKGNRTGSNKLPFITSITVTL